MGVAVTMQEWEDEAKGTVLGRPHLAAILVRKGYVSSIKQAFDKYIGQGAPAYFDKERLTPRQALERIAASGGVAVLAHPIQLRTENDAQLERVVKDLVDLGLAGIEVIHSDHDDAWVEKCTRSPTVSACSRPAAATSTARTRRTSSSARARPANPARDVRRARID